MYQLGRGVAQDYQKATEWYSKAAAQGYEKAKKSLSSLYFVSGYGIADVQEAQLDAENARVSGIEAAHRIRHKYHITSKTQATAIPQGVVLLGVHACTPLAILKDFRNVSYRFVIYPGVHIDVLFKNLPCIYTNMVVGINQEVHQAINYYNAQKVQAFEAHVNETIITLETGLTQNGLPMEVTEVIQFEASELNRYFSAEYLEGKNGKLTEQMSIARIVAYLKAKNEELEEQVTKLSEQVLSLTSQRQQPEQTKVVEPGQQSIAGFFTSKRKKTESEQEAGMARKQQKLQ